MFSDDSRLKDDENTYFNVKILAKPNQNLNLQMIHVVARRALSLS